MLKEGWNRHAVGSSCANRQKVPSWTEVRGTPDTRATRQLAQGTLPEWSDYGQGRVILFDTEAGGGVRLQQGVQTVDELEQRVWNDPTMDEATRCEAMQALFLRFTGQVGTWTPERAARMAAKCPAR